MLKREHRRKCSQSIIQLSHIYYLFLLECKSLGVGNLYCLLIPAALRTMPGVEQPFHKYRWMDKHLSHQGSGSTLCDTIMPRFYHSLLDHATHGADLMIQGRVLRQCVDVYSNPFLFRALGTWWVPSRFCIAMLELHSATAKRMPYQVMTSSLGFSRQLEREK